MRCQSAFTRDGVGRRSVSEKRHAHTNATDIFHCNDSAMPLRINVDDEGDASANAHFLLLSGRYKSKVL